MAQEARRPLSEYKRDDDPALGLGFLPVRCLTPLSDSCIDRHRLQA